MLHTLEAVITQTGQVKFSEPYTLNHSVKAYVTILPDVPDVPAEQIKKASGQALLQLLETEPFVKASLGDSVKLEQQIQHNRNAWND